MLRFLSSKIKMFFNCNQELTREEKHLWLILRAQGRICSMQAELAALRRNMDIWIADIDNCPPEMAVEYEQKLIAVKRRAAELETELEHGLLSLLRLHGINI